MAGFHPDNVAYFKLWLVVRNVFKYELIEQDGENTNVWKISYFKNDGRN